MGNDKFVEKIKEIVELRELYTKKADEAHSRNYAVSEDMYRSAADAVSDVLDILLG